MTPISSVFRPPSQQLQAAFPWHRQWLEKSPSSEGTNPQRRASEWSDWTKLPAAQAFEALKAAHGGTERNQLQQAGDVCRCLGWDDPILKWRISKLWTAYFSLLRAPVSIGHKAGRCWKMLEDAGSVVRKKAKSETHCAFPQELGCFRQSRLGRASTLANLPSQLRQRRSNPKISHMDYWLVVSTILKILVNGVGMTSHIWNGK